MNPLQRAVTSVQAGLKSFVMRFSGRTGFSYWLPGNRIDYSALVDTERNSAVVACVNWLCRTFPEAPMQVARVESNGDRTVDAQHRLAKLLKRPNTAYSGSLLWKATIADLATTGNGYWIKSRDNLGRVVALWWTPSRLMVPKWPEDGTTFISHYEYRHGMGAPSEVPVSEVVHFRDDLDPNNPRLGRSKLASLLREVFTDEEAAQYVAVTLKNLGVPGVIITPKNAEDAPDADDVEATKAGFEARFTGDNRGRVLVMSAPMDVATLGFSPNEMGVRELRRIPEERIAAVLGVPAIVAGLGAGLDRSTYSNMAEAREAAYESTIIPMQRALADDLESQLLPDFEDNPEGFAIQWDYSKVRVLQDDQDKLMVRVNIAVRGGLMSVAEGRTAIGLSADETHEYYLRPTTVTVVPVGDPVINVTPPARELPPGREDEQEEEPMQDEKSRFKNMSGPEAATGDDVVEITETDLDRAVKAWDALMPEFEGLLSAEGEESAE